jgi:hypothetical protein
MDLPLLTSNPKGNASTSQLQEENGSVSVWQGAAPAEPEVQARQEPRPPKLTHYQEKTEGAAMNHGWLAF